MKPVELSRRPSWRAPKAGGWGRGPVDLWIDADAENWDSWHLYDLRDSGDSLWFLKYDRKGHVVLPRPVWVAVTPGETVRLQGSSAFVSSTGRLCEVVAPILVTVGVGAG